MKQIAVLIRGHCRNYEKLYNNFVSNIMAFNDENLKITIFVHTWNYTNYDNIMLTDISDIKEKYNLEENNFIVEDQQQVSCNPLFYKNQNRPKFRYQLWGIYKLGSLVANYELINNMKFDYYLHTRFDILYNKNILEIINLIGNNDVLLYPKDVYTDIYSLMTNKVFTDYTNMMCMNFKRIKKIYKCYGVNPLIWTIIKSYLTIKSSIGFISR